MITRALPAIAAFIVIVIVIFIVKHEIIIVTLVDGVLKATEVSAYQAICHAGA